jgi:hypothetical protein
VALWRVSSDGEDRNDRGSSPKEDVDSTIDNRVVEQSADPSRP